MKKWLTAVQRFVAKPRNPFVPFVSGGITAILATDPGPVLEVLLNSLQAIIMLSPSMMAGSI